MSPLDESVSASAQPRIGISACLLGHPVRFNGEGKRDSWIVESLGRFVKWTPFCPEMELGLGTPREPIRLVVHKGDPQIRMKTSKSAMDLTDAALQISDKIILRLGDLDGFILKKDSPSCGLDRVKIYSQGGVPAKTGEGLFAGKLKAAFPLIPMIEEGRLCDPLQREHFVVRIFAYRRFKSVAPGIAEIQKFHQSHKLLLMAHSPKNYRALGKIAANSDRAPEQWVLETYCTLFQDTLKVPATSRKRANVLQHAYGFMKNEVDGPEKTGILDAIEEYRLGRLPFVAPLTLLAIMVKKFSIEYLREQAFFSPYPKDLTPHWL